MRIDKKEVKKLMEKYQLTEEEATKLWLEDEGYEINEEVEEMTRKAKINKTGAKASAIDKTKKKKKGGSKYKAPTEKQELYQFLVEKIKEKYENVEIMNENKLIGVQVGDLFFKIDVIKHTKKGK